MWATSAAIVSAYAPPEPAPRETWPVVPDGPDALREVLERSVEHGDEHVIKFADTAADVHARTGDPAVLAAALRVAELIDRPA